jgi:hypothetical protein
LQVVEMVVLEAVVVELVAFVKLAQPYLLLLIQ